MTNRKSWFSNSVVILTLFTCSLFFLIAVSFDQYLIVQAEETEKTVFKECIQNVFPVVSRGTEIQRSQRNQSTKDNKSIYQSIFTNVYPTMSGDYIEIASEDSTLDYNDYINKNIEEHKAEKLPDTNIRKENLVTSQKLPQKTEIDLNRPIVYLYHTHATESYIPKNEGNFHSVEEAGTVREVGERIAKNLEEKGIKVIHNKTLHDYPSYRESYSRSLKTIKEGLENNKSVRIVIDLHRDASDYKKNRKESPNINGEKAACFSMVLGTKNENVEQLKTFAEYILHKSDVLYPGLGEGIISKPYKFNQYMSDYYMLLEVGDNQNHINEALNTADCFSEILYEVIQDIKK